MRTSPTKWREEIKIEQENIKDASLFVSHSFSPPSSYILKTICFSFSKPKEPSAAMLSAPCNDFLSLASLI